MIDEIFVARAREIYPWTKDSMIEQDLILSRAIVCLFNNDIVRNALLFRGALLHE